jgi:hypothetical protein
VRREAVEEYVGFDVHWKVRDGVFDLGKTSLYLLFFLFERYDAFFCRALSAV